MPAFWRRFYVRQCILLLLSALGLALLFHFTRLDLRLADPWYRVADHRWPLREAWWTKVLVHSWLRHGVIVAAFACMWLAWHRRRAPNARRWRLVGVTAFVVPIGVTILKRHAAMHCPWDVARYGGANPYFDLLAAVPGIVTSPGRCFPAGFVSIAGWLLAFALLRYPEDRRFSRLAGLGALLLTLFFGAVQEMRGAHFLSHVLWTIWLSWATVIGLHAALGAWRGGAPTHAGAMPNAVR